MSKVTVIEKLYFPYHICLLRYQDIIIKLLKVSQETDPKIKAENGSGLIIF